MKELQHLNWRLLMDTRRYLLMAVGATALAAGIILFGIIPQIQASLELFDQRTAEDKRLKVLAKKAQDLEAMNNSPLLDQIEAVNQVLPSKKPLLELMGSLGAASRQAQVSITQLDLSPGAISTESATAAPKTTANRGKAKSGAANVENLNVDIMVEGALGDLQQFFELIETRAPLSTITDISLSRKSARQADITDADPFEAEVSISTAYFTQSVSSAVETALPSLSQQQTLLLTELSQFILPVENEQTQIEGGGLNDLFGLSQPELEELGITQ